MKRNNLKSLNKVLGLNLFGYCLVLALALSGSFHLGSAFAASVSLYAEPRLRPGVEFSIEVIVDAVNDLYGAAFDLEYDPEFLDVVDSDPGAAGVRPRIVEGALLNQNGLDGTFVRAALEDGTPGALVVGITRIGHDAGGVSASTPVSLLSAGFVPKRSGETLVRFSRQDLKDPGNSDIQVSAWEEIVINILPRYGNIDGNEIIDLRDAILILQLATFIPPAAPIVYPEGAVDVYGKIGLETAIYVLQYLGELR